MFAVTMSAMTVAGFPASDTGNFTVDIEGYRFPSPNLKTLLLGEISIFLWSSSERLALKLFHHTVPQHVFDAPQSITAAFSVSATSPVKLPWSKSALKRVIYSESSKNVCPVVLSGQVATQ